MSTNQPKQPTPYVDPHAPAEYQPGETAGEGAKEPKPEQPPAKTPAEPPKEPKKAG